jgi:hypothetical protein
MAGLSAVTGDIEPMDEMDVVPVDFRLELR